MLCFFNDSAPPQIYTLSLHDALPIYEITAEAGLHAAETGHLVISTMHTINASETRSEEHTSELQSPDHLVCRLLLEKKKSQDDIKTIGHLASITHLTDVVRR